MTVFVLDIYVVRADVERVIYPIKYQIWLNLNSTLQIARTKTRTTIAC